MICPFTSRGGSTACYLFSLFLLPLEFPSPPRYACRLSHCSSLYASPHTQVIRIKLLHKWLNFYLLFKAACIKRERSDPLQTKVNGLVESLQKQVREAKLRARAKRLAGNLSLAAPLPAAQVNLTVLHSLIYCASVQSLLPLAQHRYTYHGWGYWPKKKRTR